MPLSIRQIYSNLPEYFPAGKLDDLTNMVFRWRTIKNLRSKRMIPEDCFVKPTPRKVLIVRENFLNWAENYAGRDCSSAGAIVAG